MNSFRQIDKRILLLWALLLSLVLLCAQGAKVHVHDLDHGQDNQHSHLSKAHFAHDTSHNHYDISVIDVTPDGLLKNSNNSIFAIALFAFFFTLVIFISSRRLVQRYRENKPFPHSRYVLSPPLRAPPQY